MADTKLAKVGITVKESWKDDISYEVLDYTLWRVQDGGDGCGYIAKRANIGVVPNSDDSVWIKATQAGQSIYDLAVKYHHFDGTEEEFEAEYQAVLQAARDAASETSATNTEIQEAEELRKTAENARVEAETARQNAEQARRSNETARENAEQERTADFEGLKTDMQTAIQQADAATAAAEHMVDIHTGPEGKSAYKVAVEEGYTGTEEEWLASLKGDTGETPDISIGTVTTVEPDEPAAASMSGTPEAPVLNLSIPKGVVGDTPNITVGTVTTGEPGSSVIVTITGTPEAPFLNLTIPQGMQGNTGSSVEFPYELVNNLTTDDATKALTAAQGKVLDGKISQLEAKVDELALDLDGLSMVGNTVKYFPVHIKSGQEYIIHNRGTDNVSVYFRIAQNSDGQASLLVRFGEKKTFTPSTDFNYIYITATYNYDLFLYPADGCLHNDMDSADSVLEQKIDGISISTLSNNYNKIFIKSGISYVVENKTSVNASVNFRIDQSSTGQLLATIPAGGKATITPEVDYNFVYVYTPSSSERIYSLFVYPEESACDKIRELEEEVESINSEINVVDDIPFSVSGYINVYGAFSANDSYHTTDFIEVQTGEKLAFTLGGSSSVTVVAGYNDKKKFVGKLINSNTWLDKEIEIPQSVSFVRLCTNRENSYAKLSHNSWASRQNAIDANSFNGYFKDRITITKFGDVFNVYVRTKSGSILKYKFVHYQKTFENVPYGNGQIKESVLASNTWGMEDITHNDELIAWGSTSFIFRENGKNNHSGDQHGLEVALLDAFLLDGEPMDLASMQTGVSISGSSFEIIRKSEVYRYGTGSPNNYSNNVPELDADGNPVVLAEHFMRVIFNDNGYELDNQLCIKQNNLVFANLYGAMFDVPYSKIGTVLCNHKSGIVNTVNNGVYTPIAGSSIELKNVYVPNSDEGVVFGHGFSMMQTMESNRQQAPGIYFMDYDRLQHLKLYFQPARTTMYSEGEPEVFNEGDIIRVYDKRVINIPG